MTDGQHAEGGTSSFADVEWRSECYRSAAMAHVDVEDEEDDEARELHAELAEAEERRLVERKLSLVVGICFVFMLVEVVGGACSCAPRLPSRCSFPPVISISSLIRPTGQQPRDNDGRGAPITDVAGLVISLLAVRMAGWRPDPRFTYGYVRAEVVGALASVALIWVVTALILYEAISRPPPHTLFHPLPLSPKPLISASNRVAPTCPAETLQFRECRLFYEHPPVDGALMFVIAAFGTVANIVMAVCLHTPAVIGNDGAASSIPHFHMHLGTSGALLHVLGDLLQSIGVLIAGAVIWAYPSMQWVDLLCTFLFSFLVLATTTGITGDIVSVLLQTAPRNVDTEEVRHTLSELPGVASVHSLHVWQLSLNKSVLSCRILALPTAAPEEIAAAARRLCKKQWGIRHATIEVQRQGHGMPVPSLSSSSLSSMASSHSGHAQSPSVPLSPP
ncbi:unnamed protein product [Closterium sp. Naga37s-1]|nr:unnamed protein product [Closterium sp. Naga37s-1]